MTPSNSMTRRFVFIAVSAAALFLALLWAARPQPGGQAPQAKGWRAVTVVEGISHPWGIAWLPDGRALITARPGTLHLLENGRLERVATEGMPRIYAEGQGGLLDISLHPKGGAKPFVYMTMSAGSSEANRTILVRGVLEDRRLSRIGILFEAQPPKDSDEHFGSRILWLPGGTLLMSVGDGGNPPVRIGGMLARDQAQNRRSHLGSILRLTEDGRAAPGNPFESQTGVLPEIWTYGHRNIQGLALDPKTGRVWANEHGPRGGDELNLIEGGRNYGWPLQSHGRDYRTLQPVGRPSVEGMVDPKAVWTPSPAPSGLAFYTGDRFPNWRGSLFSGELVARSLRRIALDDKGNVLHQEILKIGSRVRDVRQGPDGFLYVLTDEDNGKLIRIEPE